MSAWRDLVATAVVGTERRAVPPQLAAEVASLLDAEVGALLDDEAPRTGAEERLLLAAGALAAARRVGATAPASTAALPVPAPDDARPVAPAKARHLLELLLDGHAPAGGAGADLIADWLTRCARGGRRLPAALAPRVLAAASAAPALRPAAVAAGGPLLTWLAARNPAWSWAAAITTTGGAGAADPAQVWADGTRDERHALLTALRTHDAAQARALLASTWPREPAADRARFVDVLATGLSPDDEPFLEAALDDRSRAVRASAAGLLAALPGSALARRMTERLRALLTVEAGGHTGDHGRRLRATPVRLAVALPEGVDAAAARDGIRERGAPPGTGRRAWLLIQMVGATPLRFWERAVAPDAATVVALGGDELLAGWTLAAARQRDPTWARHLLRVRPDPALLAALPADAAHDELPAALERGADAAAPALLAATPAPWSPATSRAVVARLRAAQPPPHAALPLLATALDPAVVAEVDAWAASLRAADPLRRRLRTIVQTLALRRAIADELA